MAERAPDPRGFDLPGAARDLEDRARRWAPLVADPDVSAAYRLLVRNPSTAKAARQAIEAEMAKLPDGGVGLEVPLFPAAAEGV